MIQEKSETCKTLTIVDWISFTYQLSGRNKPETINELRTALRYTWGAVFGASPDMRITRGPGRAGYNTSITNETNSVTIYGRIGDPDALVEISGKGCEALRRNSGLNSILHKAKHTATRIDIAVDFETDVTPKELADTCTNKRVKTRSSIVSPTGQTEYLGSRKSERYCRVYRYTKPHPRHKYLRLEMVLKAELSRYSIWNILNAGLQDTAKRAGASWRFTHPIYSDIGASPITAHRTESDMSNTLRWFHVQVVPAVRKMLNTETISWEEIVDAISNS